MVCAFTRNHVEAQDAPDDCKEQGNTLAEISDCGLTFVESNMECLCDPPPTPFQREQTSNSLGGEPSEKILEKCEGMLKFSSLQVVASGRVWEEKNF